MNSQPNILFITADDMNWDAVGAFGCPVPRTTPHIDQLADAGMRFQHGHVTIAVCQPSRSALMTGRYPHRSGGEGFFHLRKPGVPILPDILRNHGYQVGILGKVDHSTPYEDFEWDFCRDREDLGEGRNPGIYRQQAEAFLQKAKSQKQPFFLMANSHDPHRPFYGNDNQKWYGTDSGAAVPSRVFSPDEVKTPQFLADLPEVRLEISEYYSSVRRCDDTVGELLDLLKENQLEENTLVVFLSDNGMAFPFAKTNCYLNSTRTPWLMKWPGVIQAGSVESECMISGVDLFPTLLDAAGIACPENIDGHSFLPVLRGEAQTDLEFVFTQFHQTAGKKNYPMRCVQNRRFGYIFNPWSDGNRVFQNESESGRSMKAMQQAAEKDVDIAARVTLFKKRVPEEFYDFEQDPDALCNLIADPAYSGEIQQLQQELEAWMERTEDPALPAFRQRKSPAALDEFMQRTADELGGSR